MDADMIFWIGLPGAVLLGFLIDRRQRPWVYRLMEVGRIPRQAYWRVWMTLESPFWRLFRRDPDPETDRLRRTAMWWNIAGFVYGAIGVLFILLAA